MGIARIDEQALPAGAVPSQLNCRRTGGDATVN
jgi:hypothetical protein